MREQNCIDPKDDPFERRDNHLNIIVFMKLASTGALSTAGIYD